MDPLRKAFAERCWADIRQINDETRQNTLRTMTSKDYVWRWIVMNHRNTAQPSKKSDEQYATNYTRSGTENLLIHILIHYELHYSVSTTSM